MNYLYQVNYQCHNQDLCYLEMRSLFDEAIDEKVFFQDKRVNPSLSPFIKLRLKTSYKYEKFDELIEFLMKHPIKGNGFIVEYVSLNGEDEYFKNRRSYCKDVGMTFLGFPAYKEPSIRFGLSYYKGFWYFGELVYPKNDWHQHKKKPHNFSSSLNYILAKALTNIAGKGDLSSRMIDPCCGVGTVVLEAKYNDYTIDSSDINKNLVQLTKKNLLHFDYDCQVNVCNIIDLKDFYDAAIIDLPYNILNHTDQDNVIEIIRNASRSSKRQVFISSTDIRSLINELDMTLVDYCKVDKNKANKFSRYIWVCE